MIDQEKLTPEIKEKAWGSGPWVDEPDYLEFDYLGYICRIKRMSVIEGYVPRLFGGHLCGYVALNKDHPYFGLSYNDMDIYCHGGLTYREKENDDKFWIGFDCAHSSDVVPSMTQLKYEMRRNWKIDYPELEEYKYLMEDQYRTIDFVKDECKRIVDQLLEKQTK